MSLHIKATVINDEDWDFAKSDTGYMTHRIHPYPAKMIPQISQKLLRRYAHEGDMVLDPFTGSGGVLVEARLAGMNSVGIDVNPLACLISEVKSNPVNPKELETTWNRLYPVLRQEIKKNTRYELPKSLQKTNLNYWFKDQTIDDLLVIRNHLQNLEHADNRKFFSICLAYTARKVSGTRGNEFKLYRIPPEKWEQYNPKTLFEFRKIVLDAIEGMSEYYNQAPKDPFSKTYLGDNRNIFTNDFPEEGNQILKEQPPKIIVTSPPYGDSSTTVAYGQFSRYPSLWIDYEQGFQKEVIWKVDKNGLGGYKKPLFELDFPTFNQTIEAIKEKDETRAEEANAFFNDLYESLETMYKLLDNDSKCCIVVANRTMRRVKIPTHIITMEMASEIGFKDEITLIPRKIPSKRLPWKNAPENIEGLEGYTMSDENIIILSKNE